MKLAALALIIASPVVLTAPVHAQEAPRIQADATPAPAPKYAMKDASTPVDQPVRTSEPKAQKRNRSPVLHSIGYGLLTLLTATFSL
jgi:predicted cobalt transporter CbtA